MACGCGLGAVAAPAINYSNTRGMQQALNYLGMANPPLVEDGIMWGPGPSMTALKTFQKAAGITVDGNYGPQSQAALRAAVEKKAASQVPVTPGGGGVAPSVTPGGGGVAPYVTPGGGGAVTPGGGGVAPSAPASSNTMYYVAGAAVALGILAWVFLPKMMTKPGRR